MHRVDGVERFIQNYVAHLPEDVGDKPPSSLSSLPRVTFSDPSLSQIIAFLHHMTQSI